MIFNFPEEKISFTDGTNAFEKSDWRRSTTAMPARKSPGVSTNAGFET